MKNGMDSQNWVLLGTAPASEEIWGIRRIDFPCGYLVPPMSFSTAPGRLVRPADGTELWAMGGFAAQVRGDGRETNPNAARERIAGYRPWLALHHHVLLDELKERNHSIQVWDQGVSVFYGFWREGCQLVGELIPAEDFNTQSEPVALKTPSGESTGGAFADYAHAAANVVAFFSEFMTPSDGDVIVLGPLAGRRIGPNEDRLAMSAGGISLEAEIVSWNQYST